MSQTYEPIASLPELTDDLPLRSVADPGKFNDTMEKTLLELQSIFQSLNSDFIIKTNEIIVQINPIVVHSESIVAVGQNIAKVETVAFDIAAVVTTANDIAAIKAAPAAATNAATSATAAAASETSAAASAEAASADAALAEAAKDIAERIKYEVEQAQAGLLEGASVAPVPGTPVLRDAYGRSQVEAPVADKDIVNRIWALDTLNSALENFSSGLKIPVAIERESELPDIATAEEGDNYSIGDMDVSAPGFQGHAWYNPEVSTNEWQMIVVRTRTPDGTNIVLDADSKLNLSDAVQETLGKVNPISEQVVALGNALVGSVVSLAVPPPADSPYILADGRDVAIAEYQTLYNKIGRTFTPEDVAADRFCVPDARPGHPLVPSDSPYDFTDVSATLALGNTYPVGSKTAYDPYTGRYVTYWTQQPGNTNTSMHFIKWHVGEGRIVIDGGHPAPSNMYNPTAFFFHKELRLFVLCGQSGFFSVDFPDAMTGNAVFTAISGAFNVIGNYPWVVLEDDSIVTLTSSSTYAANFVRYRLTDPTTMQSSVPKITPAKWSSVFGQGFGMALPGNKCFLIRTQHGQNYIVEWGTGDNWMDFEFTYEGFEDGLTGSAHPLYSWMQQDVDCIPDFDGGYYVFRRGSASSASSARIYEGYKFRVSEEEGLVFSRQEYLDPDRKGLPNNQQGQPSFLSAVYEPTLKKIVCLSTDSAKMPAQQWRIGGTTATALKNYIHTGKIG